MGPELRCGCSSVAVGLLVAGITACGFDDATTARTASLTGPGEVVQRARLGNNTEDLAFVDRGRLVNHVVVMDGGQAIAVPVKGRTGDARLLFDTGGLGLVAAPRGIGFLAAEQHLVFNDPGQRDRLFVTDFDGILVDEIAIGYGGFVPHHVEGITVLPPSASIFPGAIVMVGWRFATSLEVHLLVIARDGTVLDDIAVDPAIAGGGITAVAYAPSGFLVSPVNAEIYKVDLEGAVIGGPVALGELESIEGIVAVPGGFIVAGYGRGRLLGLDAGLARRPRDDRDFVIGHGLSRVLGIAWDDDSASFRVGAQVVNPSRIVAVSADLVELDPVATLDEPPGGQLTGLATIPGEERVLAAHAYVGNAVLSLDAAGAIVGRLDLGPSAPTRVTYVAATDELAITFAGDAPAMVHFFTRAGAPTRSLDLSTAGIARVSGLDVDDTGSAPRLVVLDPDRRVTETDLGGNWIHSADYTASLASERYTCAENLAVVRTGPHVGALAFVCSDTNEVVIVQRL